MIHFFQVVTAMINCVLKTNFKGLKALLALQAFAIKCKYRCTQGVSF